MSPVMTQRFSVLLDVSAIVSSVVLSIPNVKREVFERASESFELERTTQ